MYCTCNSLEVKLWLITTLRLFKNILVILPGYKEQCFVYVCCGSLHFLWFVHIVEKISLH